MAEPQAANGNEHRDAVESEEHEVFLAHVGTASMPECPKAVTGIGHRGGDCHADHLRSERLVEKRSLSAGKAQDVEQADIHDQRGQAHDAELRDLSIEVAQGVLEIPVAARDQLRSGHRRSLASMRTIPGGVCAAKLWQ